MAGSTTRSSKNRNPSDLVLARGGMLRLLTAIPLPVKVLSLLGLGLSVGLLFPRSPVINAIYLSGTYFPRSIVTLAAVLVFHLLTAATAKLILHHKHRAGALFLRIVTIYVLMGIVSLIYGAVWLAFLSDIPLSLNGVPLPTPLSWARQIVSTFSHVLSQQPLLQALAGGMLMGWLTASFRALRPAAYGFIAASDWILTVFRKLLWYYPIMIGCLAIGIPLKFGHRGLALYGQCVLWDMIVIGVWCAAMVLFCKTATRRTWRQILSYYGTVWPTGFGTGGSYDTLAVNLISAEKDLGLDREIAEISIVFGTVLNKNCATMSVLLVTVIVAKLLGVPISLLEIVLLIPPVVILGLESPGIPGGAGYFMSPVIASLLHVPNPALWVTTFVAVYSGLIPMFSTAGNTTDDGVVGAILEDRFQRASTQVTVSHIQNKAPLQKGEA
jgi:Na+/H+-dicarboxylate symporter